MGLGWTGSPVDSCACSMRIMGSDQAIRSNRYVEREENKNR